MRLTEKDIKSKSPNKTVGIEKAKTEIRTILDKSTISRNDILEAYKILLILRSLNLIDTLKLAIPDEILALSRKISDPWARAYFMFIIQYSPPSIPDTSVDVNHIINRKIYFKSEILKYHGSYLSGL